MSEHDEEKNYSDDAAPTFGILQLKNLKIANTGPLKTTNESTDQIAALPCGHGMPTDYLVAWCKGMIKQNKTKFTCPRYDEIKKQTCGRGFSYHNLCQLASLTSSQKEFFEEQLETLTAEQICKYKACPGCQSFVERADKNNLCVHCTICTAQRKSRYDFCWNCRRDWKRPAPNAVHCGYSDCVEKQISQTRRSLLKLCQPTFKIQKLQSEQIYQTKKKSCDRKRLAMIINNIEFRDSHWNREGADKDEENIRALLEDLGYELIILNDLSAEGMDAALKDFSQRSEHRDSDSTFVVIMSHGGPEGIFGINTDDNEGDAFPVDKIFHYLDSENCPRLTDKPKIILIQACRGDKKGHVWVTDGVGPSKGKMHHREKDFGCFRSCTPETVSIRDPCTGTVFIQSLVQIFNKHAHEDDIMELFRKTSYMFEEEAKKGNFPYQMPCLERTTLVKKFYLFPGL